MNKEAHGFTGSASFALASKVKDYFQLIKFTLSFMVVFSCVVCYLLAPNIKFDLVSVLLLFTAGMLITGSANAINQAVEKDTDALMKRTASRPVASGRMTANEAYVFAIITGFIGVVIMWYWFNFASAMIGLFSLFLYAFIYTPLKKINSVSVLVGAFPGALPCLIGWVAGADEFSTGGWILFGIQFLWQFPHFWAIAWVSYDDYAKAGFQLLPSNTGKSKTTASYIVIYTLLLLPVSLILYMTGYTGKISAIIVFLSGCVFLYQATKLFRSCDTKDARNLMFGSFLYLPIVLIALLMDKI